MKSNNSTLFVLFGLFLLTSCHTRQPNEPLAASPAAMQYASLIQMQDLDDGLTLCRIQNPWQPDRIAMQYLLIPEQDTLITPQHLDHIEQLYGQVQTLSVPLRQQTITSACYAYLYDQLGALEYIGAMCDTEYVLDSLVCADLRSGRIADAGNSMSPNAEVILSAQSEAIWVTPYETGSQAVLSATLPQIPIIYCADYLENSPLGRAEWMRFFGRLVDKAPQADSLFHLVEQNYLSLSQDTVYHTAPSLLCELPYGATWYVAGGRSTMGWLYQDAGFRYLWADDVHGGSLALSQEAVYDRGQQADVWIIKYYSPEGDWTLSNVLELNPMYREFRSCQIGRVFGCNTAQSDYYEVTPFRPDWILSEMRHICQNENDSLMFFKPL